MSSIDTKVECEGGDYSSSINFIVSSINADNDSMFEEHFDEQHLDASSASTSTGKVAQGPRASGEGIEPRQGILYAYRNGPETMYIFTTMLVAGFLIGRLGQSIQSISRRTGSQITSVNKTHNGRKVRVFQIQGSEESIYKALKIMMAAIHHYKRLVEGEYKGLFVQKDQVIEGITFQYEAPPLRDVPWSARVLHDQDYHLPSHSQEGYQTLSEQILANQPSPCSPISFSSNHSYPYMPARSYPTLPQPPLHEQQAFQKMEYTTYNHYNPPLHWGGQQSNTPSPYHHLHADQRIGHSQQQQQGARVPSYSPFNPQVAAAAAASYTSCYPPHTYQPRFQYYDNYTNQIEQRNLNRIAQPSIYCGDYYHNDAASYM